MPSLTNKHNMRFGALLLLCSWLLAVSSTNFVKAATSRRIGISTATMSRAAFLTRKQQQPPRISLSLLQPYSMATHVALTTRGGAESDNKEEEEDSDDDSDSDGDSDAEEETVEADNDADDEEEVSDSETEDEEDVYMDDEEEEEVTAVATTRKSKKKKGVKKQEYDEPYFMSPSMYLYTTFVPILIGRKIDLYQPRIVRLLRYVDGMGCVLIARIATFRIVRSHCLYSVFYIHSFLFITQLLVQQAFIFYVRIMAKTNNDRTIIHLESPVDTMLKSKMGGADLGSNEGLKKLMSNFLSKDVTVMQYDMDQAKGMQTSIIITMIITWVMHFKFQQVQPLLMTIISGYFQLFMNPLFQIYILGRNLERPFKAPKPAWMEENEDATDTPESTAEEESKTEATTADADTEETVEEGEDEADEVEEGSDSDEDSDDEEEDDGDDDE